MADDERGAVTDGFRKCDFCGCVTNARLRACCERGRARDKESPPMTDDSERGPDAAQCGDVRDTTGRCVGVCVLRPGHAGAHAAAVLAGRHIGIATDDERGKMSAAQVAWEFADLRKCDAERADIDAISAAIDRDAASAEREAAKVREAKIEAACMFAQELAGIHAAFAERGMPVATDDRTLGESFGAALARMLAAAREEGRAEERLAIAAELRALHAVEGTVLK